MFYIYPVDPNLFDYIYTTNSVLERFVWCIWCNIYCNTNNTTADEDIHLIDEFLQEWIWLFYFFCTSGRFYLCEWRESSQMAENRWKKWQSIWITLFYNILLLDKFHGNFIFSTTKKRSNKNRNVIILKKNKWNCCLNVLLLSKC